MTGSQCDRSLYFLTVCFVLPLLPADDGHKDFIICAKGNSICIPKNYSKFDLPNEITTTVNVGIDIKDIPKISDKDFSVTLNAFFVVRWMEDRLHIDQARMENTWMENDWIPVDVSFIKEVWLPDTEILNLKEFKTLRVLSNLEGLWLNKNYEIMYAVAARITFICPMTFNSFPLDVQVCLFQVGSFNYDNGKMVFVDDEFLANQSQIRSVLDYSVEIQKLPKGEQNYQAPTGNYSVAGFKLILVRKISHYIITCYLPSAMFVLVSWISFLIPADIVPGRMTLLITIFLVLVNIFNTITTNIPKAEGLTAIEAFVIVCVLFVFGALMEYAGILLQMKLRFALKRKMTTKAGQRTEDSSNKQIALHNLVSPSETKSKTVLKKNSRPLSEEKMRIARLDLIFLIIFPCLFVLFNVIYWASFLYIIPDFNKS